MLGRSTGEDALRLFEPSTLDLTGRSMGEFDAENDNGGPVVDGRPGVEGAEGAGSSPLHGRLTHRRFEPIKMVCIGPATVVVAQTRVKPRLRSGVDGMLL